VRAIFYRSHITVHRLTNREAVILSRNDFLRDLYLNHQKNVAVFIKSMIYSKRIHDVEDCVQEVFLAAIKSPELEKHPNIEGWFYNTATNIALKFNDKLELMKKTPLIIDDDEVVFEAIIDDFSEQLIEDIEYERLMSEGIIDKIMEELSEREKYFYFLRFKEKHGNKKISEITGKKEVAVRVRLMRLKDKIKKILKNYVTNEI
jgi:RNA polymerase sigma-70 factor (ECF subfamily)